MGIFQEQMSDGPFRHFTKIQNMSDDCDIGDLSSEMPTNHIIRNCALNRRERRSACRVIRPDSQNITPPVSARCVRCKRTNHCLVQEHKAAWHTCITVRMMLQENFLLASNLENVEFLEEVEIFKDRQFFRLPTSRM